MYCSLPFWLLSERRRLLHNGIPRNYMAIGWKQAQTTCNGLGQHLLTIRDTGGIHVQVLTYVYTNGQIYYIGLEQTVCFIIYFQHSSCPNIKFLFGCMGSESL